MARYDVARIAGPVTEPATDAPAGLPAAPAPQQTGVRKGPKPKPPPADFGPIQVLRYTGLAGWQWDAGAAAGLIPPADVGERRWSRAAADDVAARHDEIVAVIGTEAPVGGHRAADLAVPRTHTAVQIIRYRWVDVPLYRTGDLGMLREHPGIDWEAVRAVRPGEPSPLRELARRPVDRAAAIRCWVAEDGDRHSIEVWAWFNPGSGGWELDFERVDGGPAVKDVKAAIAAHRYLRDYPIAVATEAGAAIRWTRAMRKPGAAVILDTVIRAVGCLSDRAKQHLPPCSAAPVP